MTGAPSEVFSHAAELVSMGLNVPCMTQVLLRLQQLGVNVPASAYTVEQAADLLEPLLKGARRYAEGRDPRPVFPGQTPIHKLDPRTKLVLVIVYIVALFLAKWFVSYVVIAAFLAIVIAMSKIRLKVVLKTSSRFCSSSS